MRYLYQFLNLAPAPLFFVGFLYSVINPPALCTAFPYEMALMWFIMTLAHLTPWIIWWQQRNFSRPWKTAVISTLQHGPWLPVAEFYEIWSIWWQPYDIVDHDSTARACDHRGSSCMNCVRDWYQSDHGSVLSPLDKYPNTCSAPQQSTPWSMQTQMHAIGWLYTIVWSHLPSWD